jgi:hypothetical protein
MHFCPNPDCAYRGWVGWGNLRANGHPNGGPWRQLLCVVCRGYCLETLGTLFHGKRAPVELIVRVIACLAEGLGIRGTARVFEVDPQTVLQWLVEAAEQLRAFSQHFLYDLRVRQVQLDELFALLSAVRDGEVSETEAIARLERYPQWVWVAMDPESKLLLALDVGDRTLAMAQRVVHYVAQVLAPDCAPLFLTDGFREYLTALVTHYGHWVQPPRRQTTGPHPKPRWMPQPQLLYAQVVKTVRRRRLVRVRHHVVFGTLEAANAVLAPLGWQINTAFVVICQKGLPLCHERFATRRDRNGLSRPSLATSHDLLARSDVPQFHITVQNYQRETAGLACISVEGSRQNSTEQLFCSICIHLPHPLVRVPTAASTPRPLCRRPLLRASGVGRNAPFTFSPKTSCAVCSRPCGRNGIARFFWSRIGMGCARLRLGCCSAPMSICSRGGLPFIGSKGHSPACTPCSRM